jgi:hypothetical protein
MRRSSRRWRRAALGAVLSLAAACGREAAPDGSAAGAAQGSAATERAAAESASAPAASAPSPAAEDAPAARPGIGGTRELVNPEPLAMVLLHHELAGTEPAIARWVEEDFRVVSARPIDKPAQRELVRGELEAARAAVRGVGALRLTLAAELSDYDPSYGEFTVRSLAPSRVVSFDAMREKVELRFANGLDAQVWRVPAEEAQLVRDKVGPFGNTTLDVLVRITDVQPGGTLVTQVVEYELRADRSGERLGRVRVD